MSSELGAGRVSLVLPWLAVPHLHSNNPAASSSGRDFTLTGDSPIFLGGDLPEIVYNFA